VSGIEVSATLRDTVTGDSRVYTRTWTNEGDVDDERYLRGILFYWEDGNGSCDCNRSIFLWPDDDDKELPCSRGDNRIVLDRLVIGGFDVTDLHYWDAGT